MELKRKRTVNSPNIQCKELVNDFFFFILEPAEDGQNNMNTMPYSYRFCVIYDYIFISVFTIFIPQFRDLLNAGGRVLERVIDLKL